MSTNFNPDMSTIQTQEPKMLRVWCVRQMSCQNLVGAAPFSHKKLCEAKLIKNRKGRESKLELQTEVDGEVSSSAKMTTKKRKTTDDDW